MRGGFFGSVQESDPSEVLLKTLHRIREKLDADTQQRKKRTGTGLRTRAIQEGRAISRCLCVVHLGGPRPLVREKVVSGATLNLAIADGLEWALLLGNRKTGIRRVIEIRMNHLLLGGKDDTLAGQTCFAWKAGTTTIEQKLDRILADILGLKQREMEELVDRLVAHELLQKLKELEEMLQQPSPALQRESPECPSSKTTLRKHQMTPSFSQWKEQQYQAGRSAGEAIMAGRVGSTRFGALKGEEYRRPAREIATSLGWPEAEVNRKVTAYHRERLATVPDAATYPEIREERELVLERYRGMADSGMSEELIALVETLAFWRDYGARKELGKTYYRLATERKSHERCRIVFLPETDQGPLHMKNVDDPLETWKPLSPGTRLDPAALRSPLSFDGVGNGLHIDEMPLEIFPLNAREMTMRRCATLSEASEMLVRYNYFWGGGNLLIRDEHHDSLAFDKASRRRIAIRKPGRNGINYVNGMSSFDPDHEAFIEKQRELYLHETKQSKTSVEAVYFQFSKGVLKNMERYMAELSRAPTLDNLIRIMTSRDPDGPMCKPGTLVHPDQPAHEATLLQLLYVLNKKQIRMRQWRGQTPVWEDSWEVIPF
jgi:hypothetical protein